MKESKFLKMVLKIEDKVFLIEKVVSMILVVLMATVTFAQVISRYVFGKSLLVGIDELINWTFVWLVFIGIGMMVRHGGHIGLEFFYNRLPAKLRKVGTVIVDLLLIGMAAFIFVGSLPFVQTQMGILTTSANIPKAYLYSAIPAGMCILAFHLLVKIVKVCCSGAEEN